MLVWYVEELDRRTRSGRRSGSVGHGEFCLGPFLQDVDCEMQQVGGGAVPAQVIVFDLFRISVHPCCYVGELVGVVIASPSQFVILLLCLLP